DFSGTRLLRDLRRVALMQHEPDFGKPRRELRQDGWQHVARLRMRGRDAEHARIFAPKLVGNALEVADLAQRAARDGDDDFAGWRQRREALSLAHENAQAELVFELSNLLADARLGRVKRFGRVGDVEAVVDDGAEVLQLLKVHQL